MSGSNLGNKSWREAAIARLNALAGVDDCGIIPPTASSGINRDANPMWRAQPPVEKLARNAPNHGVETGQDQPQVE